MLIENQVPLQHHTSLALPGVAEFFCRAETLEQLQQALAFAHAKQLPLTLLGAGSNTVVAGDAAGLVLAVALKGIALLAEDEKSVHIRVAAGENWHQLVSYCLAQGWFGVENLALIPGLAGSAPIQNIGAYGVELASVLEAVDVLDLATGEVRQMAADACQLRYRDSIFKCKLKGRVVITAIYLGLHKTPQANVQYPELRAALAAVAAPTPKDVFTAVCALRTAKLPDPNQLPNAGSFFKNPVLAAEAAKRLLCQHPDIPHYPQADGRIKFPAAWLIDRAGWKGFRRGAVGVHRRQALVLVHFGGGTGAELLALANEIAADVAHKFAVQLELEPVVIGD